MTVQAAMLGVGIMGGGMARRLLGAGFPLKVYNRDAEKAMALESAGAKVAKTPREAAAGAQVIISMLADDNASRSVWLGDNGALAGAARGTVLVESSTVTVGWIQSLDQVAREAGCELIDAPVTGSKMQAAAGELNFIVGGSESALAKAKPLLDAMGKSITHLGPIGSGALMKLINNFVCGVQAASLAEALAWMEKAHLDIDKALPVMTNGAPGSPLFKALSARMTSRDFTPNFMLKLLAKDLTYATQEAAKLSLNLETGQAALDLLQKAITSGYGESDMSAVVEAIRKQ